MFRHFFVGFQLQKQAQHCFKTYSLNKWQCDRGSVSSTLIPNCVQTLMEYQVQSWWIWQISLTLCCHFVTSTLPIHTSCFHQGARIVSTSDDDLSCAMDFYFMLGKSNWLMGVLHQQSPTNIVWLHRLRARIFWALVCGSLYDTLNNAYIYSIYIHKYIYT